MRTEGDLKAELATLQKRMGEIIDELAQPRFGWVTTPAPRRGVIEVLNGFRTRIYSRLYMDWQLVDVFPGLVDAGVYQVPDGTTWRSVSTSGPQTSAAPRTIR